MERVREPRMEDFGITEGDLAQAPCSFLSDHRLGAISIAYVVVAAAVFIAILRTGGSYPAAAFFTVVSLAAGSVLLLPALIFLLCASEQAEERWLCSRFPKLRSCLAYRRAVAEYARTIRAMTDAAPSAPQWSVLSRPALVEAIHAWVGRVAALPSVELDVEECGADLMISLTGRPVLVRCEPGPGPVGAAIGREVVAALMDHQAAGALIVSPGEASAALEHYLDDRPIRCVRPWQLTDAPADSELLVF